MVLLCGSVFIYTNDYYHADSGAMAIVNAERVEKIDEGYAVIPNKIECGMIFYPGAKVQTEAYLPLMQACAERGILCVLMKMPLNLAMLDVNAADRIFKQFPNVDEWYIAGHSMGGAAGAMYAAKNSDRLEGVILLGAYSTADVTDVKVLSVFGSEDEVLSEKKYWKYLKNLPVDFTEYEIPGGNHAGFGKYGEQKGDGEAMITGDEQIAITADFISKFIQDS